MSAHVFEIQSIIWSQRLIVAILVTGIFATFIAILLMIWSQKILKPTETALIFSLEPVAAAFFAVTFGGEILGIWALTGGGLICIAIASYKSN